MIKKFAFGIVLPLMLIGSNTINEVCTLETSQEFGYTGDTSGKRVNTKEEFTYKCIKTDSTNGECKRWQTEETKIDISGLAPNTLVFETEDFTGSMGGLLAITQAYDKINGLWSGWAGICQSGMNDGNWDWMTDPYFLASAALTVYTAGAGGSSEAMIGAGQESQSIAQAAEILRKNAQLLKYAVCAAQAGINVGKTIEEYNSDDFSCDPIDEICGETKSNNDEQIYTLPEIKLDDMLSNNPEMVDYIEIISGVGTGTVIVRIIKPANNRNFSAAAKAAEEAAQKIKDMMLVVRSLITTIQLAQCLSKGQTSVSGAGDPTSAQNLSVSAIGLYNPMAGLALDVAINTITSLTPINTCSDRKDAKEKGSRHIATLESNEKNLCHFVKSTTTGSSLRMNKRTKRRYCCYDDKITRILVEQVKAQFAKDWQHCTDITLAELSNVSFSPCDPVALDSSVDGTKLNYYSTLGERLNAYQYKNKCIDTREYLSHMKETFGGEDMLLDTSDLEDRLNDLK